MHLAPKVFVSKPHTPQPISFFHVQNGCALHITHSGVVPDCVAQVVPRVVQTWVSIEHLATKSLSAILCAMPRLPRLRRLHRFMATLIVPSLGPSLGPFLCSVVPEKSEASWFAQLRSWEARRKVSDQRAFNALVRCQKLHLQSILAELDQGFKQSHWAWYIFPTEKAGFNDEYQTRITSENAVDLCNQSTAKDWRRCLEKICDLLEARDKRPPDDHVLPFVDHGRVHWFVQFWTSYSQSPEWMLQVCSRLEKIGFPAD